MQHFDHGLQVGAGNVLQAEAVPAGGSMREARIDLHDVIVFEPAERLPLVGTHGPLARNFERNLPIERVLPGEEDLPERAAAQFFQELELAHEHAGSWFPWRRWRQDLGRRDGRDDPRLGKTRSPRVGGVELRFRVHAKFVRSEASGPADQCTRDVRAWWRQVSNLPERFRQVGNVPPRKKPTLIK